MADEKIETKASSNIPKWDAFDFTGKIWDNIKAFFALQWEDFWKKFLDVSFSFNDQIWDQFVEKLNTYDDPLWDKTFQFLEYSGILSDEQKDFIMKFKDIPAPMNFLIWLAYVIVVIPTYMFNIAGSSNDSVRFSIAEKYQTSIPPIETLIQSAFIAPEKTQDIRKLLYKYGFNKDMQDLMFLSRYRLYDVDMIRELWFRGVLDDNKMYERMRELGFTDTRTEELVQAFPVIPGPSDLFHLVGKEAFEPETIQKLGLGDEFPEEQLTWLNKQGVSRYWAEKYWAAHWMQPSVQQGMAMFHRSLISAEELDLLFRAQEIPPFWRDKLLGITYYPYTRVDLRRLWREGILKDVEEVYTEYKWQGYDHKHAVNLTKFAIADAEQPEKDLSMSQIMKSFKKKAITRDRTKELLATIGYTEQKAEFLILNAEYEDNLEMLEDQIDVIKEQFQNRIIDKFDAIRELNLLGLNNAQIMGYLEKWEIKILKARKIPSKADLKRFWQLHLIDDKRYYAEMDKLGYAKDYTNLYINQLKKELPAPITKLPDKKDLTDFYLNQVVDENTYKLRMKELGYVDKDIELYVRLLHRKVEEM